MKHKNRYLTSRKDWPENFPTHMHSDVFWAKLGRAVATFGCLEEVLGKAIFSFTATKPYHESEVQEAYEKWSPKIKKCLTDQLGRLIDSYKKAVTNHPESTLENLDELITDLKHISIVRNVLCHASWNHPPNAEGATTPYFFNNKAQKFNIPIDIKYLEQTQQHTTELICAVINSVIHMGWAFPGTDGPGEMIMKKKDEV